MPLLRRCWADAVFAAAKVRFLVRANRAAILQLLFNSIGIRHSLDVGVRDSRACILVGAITDEAVRRLVKYRRIARS